MLTSSFLSADTAANKKNPEIRANFICKEMEEAPEIANSILGNIINDMDTLVHLRDFCTEAARLHEEKPDSYEVEALVSSFCKVAPEAVVDLIKFMHSYVIAKASYVGDEITITIANSIEEMLPEDDDSGCECEGSFHVDEPVPLFDDPTETTTEEG